MKKLVNIIALILVLIGSAYSSISYGQNDYPGSEQKRYDEYISEPGTTRIDNRYREHRQKESTDAATVLNFAFITWGYYIIYYIVALIVAGIIFKNAKATEKLALNIRPIWWATLVFFDPVLGVLVFWVMNILDLPSWLKRSSEIKA